MNRAGLGARRAAAVAAVGLAAIVLQLAVPGCAEWGITARDQEADSDSAPEGLGTSSGDRHKPPHGSPAPEDDGPDPVDRGRYVFRHDTFGDEEFWGGQLRLHEAIAGEANGGTGPGVSPKTALELGLKVDVGALPRALQGDLREGGVDLDDPAITVALLKLGAVVGLTGVFDDAGTLSSLGIQCALCHSVVDDSLAAGIGRRLDGWPNRDLNVGAIVAAAPDLSAYTELLGVDDATLRQVLNGWGVGKFDAFVFLDGKATRPDGQSAAVLIPPLFGLASSGLVTWNGWSSLAAWVPLVITVEMHGKGTFADRRLRDERFPIAVVAGYASIRNEPDLATSKLADLEAFLLALRIPEPPPDSFDASAAERGSDLFTGKARCSNCHVPPLNTLPGWNVVSAEAIGIDSFHADRSPSHGYRPPPLHAIFTRTKGGFFHDGRFAQLADVVAHFNGHFGLGLSAAEQADLVEFLKSI